MNDRNSATFTYPNLHVAWLACLFCLLRKVHREGLMSIEADVQFPENLGSIFQRFPQAQSQPYLSFAADILRLMVGGNLNTNDCSVYAEHYIAGLLATDEGVTSEIDETLLRTIWLTLWAAMQGYPPQVAIEFGRQGIPTKDKPSFTELEDLHREIPRAEDFRNSREPDGLDETIDRFLESIGAATPKEAEVIPLRPENCP